MNPTPAELDITTALRTVAINGSHNASRAMSKWLRRGVRLTSDGFQAVPITEAVACIAEPDETVAAIHLPLAGDMTGHMLLAFPDATARRLTDLILQVAEGTTQDIGELEQSCLEETGNIVCSAYTNSLSKWLSMHVEPGVPSFAYDLTCAVVEPLLTDAACDHDETLIAMTDFLLDQQRLRWGMMLLPAHASWQAMMDRCDLDAVRQHAMQTIAVNGAFNASRAMSKWLKRGVKISTDGFVRVPIQDLANCFGESTTIAAMHLPLSDPLRGHALLCIRTDDAMRLADLLLGRPVGTATEIGELEQSSLEETGNIVASSFVNSWSAWLDVHVEPSAPRFVVDLPQAVIETIVAEQAVSDDDVFFTKTDFVVDDHWLEWMFVLLPAPSSIRFIEASCR